MNKKLLFTFIIILAGLAIVGAANSKEYVFNADKDIIPKNISRQVEFTPFAPEKSAELQVEESTIKYSPSDKGLSFIIRSPESGRLTISQQATPREFIDIPDYYTKLVDRLNRYSVFQNQTGTVYLTRPSDQKTGQTAVMNAGGVLMFVRSEKDLTDDQWKQIFSSIKQG